MKKLLQVIALAGSIVLLAACSSGQSPSAGAVGDPTLHLGVSDQMASINPLDINFFAEGEADRLLYPYLLEYSPSGKLVGSFAKTWTSSSDGRVWTFTTQANAKWSDGRPLTASDAAWTFQTLLKYQSSVAAFLSFYLANISQVTAPSPTTLVVTLSKPTADVLDNLASLAILPEHVWASHVGTGGSGLKSLTNLNPNVSGGPFEMQEFTPNQTAVFSRNPNWFGRKFSVKTVELEFFANPDSAIQALKSGSVDLLVRPPLNSVAALQNDPNISIQSGVGGEQYNIIMDTDPAKKANRELLDPKLRYAISLAINRTQLSQIAFGGQLQPASSMVGPIGGPLRNSSIPGDIYNPAKANQLLDAAGYARGPGGERTYKGRPITLQLFTVTDVEGSTRAFDVIQQNLAAVGITITPDNLDPNAAFTYEGTKQFDMGLFSGSASYDPTPVLLSFTCASLKSFNPTRFCDPTYDALFEAQATEANPSQRQQTIWQMQEMLLTQSPEIVLGYTKGLTIHSSAWTGFQVLPDGPFSLFSSQGLLSARRT
ncbi:MAG: ABC transporter substrate-binding protein, partial [Streptosporangiaceae bacterium]